jgi:hypothetical protein
MIMIGRVTYGRVAPVSGGFYQVEGAPGPSLLGTGGESRSLAFGDLGMRGLGNSSAGVPQYLDFEAWETTLSSDRVPRKSGGPVISPEETL